MQTVSGRINAVKQFSHSDLDGVGSIVMGKYVFGSEANVVHEICDYDNVNEKVLEFVYTYMSDTGVIKEFCPYQMILITDISITEETAMILDAFCIRAGIQLLLIDHHKTTTPLAEKFDWVIVKYMDEETKIKTSGTSQMYDILVHNNPSMSEEYKQALYDFAEVVRSYDTWDWVKNNEPYPGRLNTLLFAIGHEPFITRFENNLKLPFTETEKLVIDLDEARANKYIEQRLEKVKIHKFAGYTIGLVFADENTSRLGNEICKKYPELDFAFIVNMYRETISMRGTNYDLDLGALSKECFGGGGHPVAAGAEPKQLFAAIDKAVAKSLKQHSPNWRTKLKKRINSILKGY